MSGGKFCKKEDTIQYLFLISVLVLPLLLFFRSKRGQRFIAKLAGWCDHWGGIFLFLIPLAVIRIALTHLFQGQQHSWAHFLTFTVFFLIGYIIPVDERFTKGIKSVGWLCLVLEIVGAVLPFYIFHQTIILCVGWFVIRWNMRILSKYLIIAMISFILIIALYEVLVRPFNLMRLLFGMRSKKTPVYR